MHTTCYRSVGLRRCLVVSFGLVCSVFLGCGFPAVVSASFPCAFAVFGAMLRSGRSAVVVCLNHLHVSMQGVSYTRNSATSPLELCIRWKGLGALALVGSSARVLQPPRALHSM